MAFDLSFSDEFYIIEGDQEMMPKDMENKKPVTVWQALVALPYKTWQALATEIFKCPVDFLDISDVIDRIRETNTFSNLSSPITVWIDEEGFYTVDVFDIQKEKK